MTNNRWFSVIVGALVAAVVFAYCIAVLVAQKGIEPKDWLNFIGVIVGVMLTVGTSQAITWLSARRQRGERTQDLITAIEDLLKTVPQDVSQLGVSHKVLWMIQQVSQKQFEYCYTRLDHPPRRVAILRNVYDTYYSAFFEDVDGIDDIETGVLQYQRFANFARKTLLAMKQTLQGVEEHPEDADENEDMIPPADDDDDDASVIPIR